ncbi:hypothetical protein AAE02nite_03470 [Adhaeribacter aerolatus]|uniref:Uncharacterized protein n=1 Tax=Adhaeribacter aerolatus TaxID=670289 RepID=A0A512ASJ9_9BACT|nr:hypothetical protein [Adhaeribacter aerolatus]GEO02683.1 hypothetical protein AAE02nite_03470 [Adhaeribacter aerolatus]
MMRLLLVVSLFFVFSVPSFGQVFGFEQLVSLTKRDSAAVSSYVAEKKWILSEAKVPTETTAGRLTWKHSALSKADQFAQNWLVYFYKDNKCRRLSYATLDAKTFEALKRQITSKNMRKVSSKNAKGLSQTTYQWGSYTVMLEQNSNSVDQENKPIKSFEITIDIM